jgi:nucleoside-diphosphate-sugar epimerase
MPAVVVDVSRAGALGWSPEITLLDGIRTAWADFAPAATT